MYCTITVIQNQNLAFMTLRNVSSIQNWEIAACNFCFSSSVPFGRDYKIPQDLKFLPENKTKIFKIHKIIISVGLSI